MWLCRSSLAAALGVLAAGCVAGEISSPEIGLSAGAGRVDASAYDDDAGHVAMLDAATSGGGPSPRMGAAPPPAPKPQVTFDPQGRGFSSPFALTLGAGEPDAVLHYTVDGSLPSESSPAVSGPIMISTTTLVRVISVKAGAAGPVFNQSYFELDPS